MSSAEAEFYTVVEGVTRGIGFRSMLEEMGEVRGNQFFFRFSFSVTSPAVG